MNGDAVLPLDPARLRALRTERGWGLRKLAARAHLHPKTIINAEHGRSRPSAKTVKALAEALGVPVEALMADRAGRPGARSPHPQGRPAA